MVEYAVYKGNELIVTGTAQECADFMNVSSKYIRWMTSPTGKRRLAGRKNPSKCTTAERIEDDDEENLNGKRMVD